MADNDKGQGSGGEGGPIDDRLSKVLESKYDPGRLSRLMKAGSASRGDRLDMTARSRFERRLGVDLANVRVFRGELAEEITRAHNAEALTIGDTGMILMRQSAAFAPGTAAGTALLAHELTHVAQARPSTVSRKKTSTEGLAEEDAEVEAEEQEAQVHAEEKGGKPDMSTEAEKDESQRERKRELTEAVLKIMEEERFMHHLRMGPEDPSH